MVDKEDIVSNLSLDSQQHTMIPSTTTGQLSSQVLLILKILVLLFLALLIGGKSQGATKRAVRI